MSYYYAYNKKDKNDMVWNEIPGSENLDQAKSILKAHLIMTRSNDTVDDCSFMSDKEFFDFRLKQKQAEEEECKKKREMLELDSVAQNIYNKILRNNYKYIQDVSKSLKIDTDIDNLISEIKRYGLKENIDKPYYIHCDWGYSVNGMFGNIEDIEEICVDKFNSSYTDGFNVDVYNAKTCKKLNIKIKVEIEE